LLGGLLLLALLGGSIIGAWTDALRETFFALP
jgi:hypothetical protein